ncbi:integral membrane protein [Colletotrichum abscissum]|uniref:Integral membrane protein n=1 Tax=Colletotrichum abscissum TaxID=1671311 RepID=A0A9Q0B750_9PEZI|nr:integral membrane protein [Colletotrichum abscissum]
MHSFRVVSVLLVSLGGLGVAAKSLSLEGIPSCAITCMVKALPSTTCSPTDQACLCVDSKFNAAVQPCIQSTCTIQESLVVTNATWSNCGFPYSDQTSNIHLISGVVTAIGIIFIMMRMATKIAKLSAWGADDTVIIVAFRVIGCLGINTTFSVVKAGLGKDIWTLHDYEITYFLKLLFVLEFFYIIGLGVVKASILFFFLKIFPNRGFRRILWLMQILNMLVVLSYVVLCFAQCQPFSHFWNGWDGAHEGHCVDLNRIGLSHVSLNITLDIIMLILPITQIYKLQLNRKKKVGVMAMFLVGIFLTIVSILRIKTLIAFATSLNTTADSVAVVLWAYVELGVGIVVACMPNVWQLLKTLPSKVIQLSTTLASNMSHSGTRTRPSSQIFLDKRSPTKQSFTESSSIQVASASSPSVSIH